MSDHPGMKVSTYMSGFFIGLCLFSAALAENAQTKTTEKPVQVTLRPLSKLLTNIKSSAPASVISLKHATISAEITGTITTIYAEAGERVKKGVRLASIDCRSYDLTHQQAVAALKVAKARFNLAKKQFVRNQGLVRQGTISREIFDQADANQRTTLADIELKNVQIASAKLAVSRCQIFAPFSGQITQRMVQEGQLVTPATPLFHLLQTDNLEIKASLSPLEIAFAKNSPSLEFVAGKRNWAVKLRSVIQMVDETTRTQEVRLSLPKKAEVATGLSGRLEWRSNTPKLSADYLLRRGDSLGVMIAEGIDKQQGKARFFPLPDAKEGQPAFIDLPANTQIIDQNRYRVKDGQAISVILKTTKKLGNR